MTDNEIQLETKLSKKPLFGVILIIAAICLYIFFTKPIANNVSSLKADVVSKKAEIETLKNQIDEIKKAEQDFGLATEVQRLESLKAIPTAMNQDEVINDLIKIVDIYGIKLTSIGFAKGGTSDDLIGSLKVNASFEGNYLDLMDFLKGLEQNARLFKVDSINVQVNQLEISNIKRANFSLSIEAFFQN